jgi:hypothetical protein
MPKDKANVITVVSEDTPVKACSKCEQSKPAILAFFRQNPDGRFGLHSVCIECQNALNREKKAAFRKENPEKAREIGREDQRKLRRQRGAKDATEYRKQRLEAKTKVCSKCGIEKPKEEFPFNKALATIDNRGSRCRQCCRNHRKALSRKKLRQDWAWRLRQYALQRQHKYDGSTDLTVEFLFGLYAGQQGRCYWTLVPLTLELGSGLTAVSLDRLDCKRGYTMDNVVLSCIAANTARGNATPDQFAEFLGLVGEALKEE